jgi:mono/diheme cytochrome c family protein
VFLAMTSAVKALVFVLFLVLIPTVPVTLAVSRAMRRSRWAPDEREVTSGRAASTPFRMISAVGIVATACVFLALVIVLTAQSFANSDEGESVAPVENGGAGDPQDETIGSPVPEQGNATAGKTVFSKAGCGKCHSLQAANARGTTGPNLDTDQPDFTKVVECVTTGPGDMPSFAGRLSNAEIRNVAKFVAVVARDPQDSADSDDSDDLDPPP